MGTKKKKQSVVLLLLLLAVILMTIGFAAYAQTLTINGNVTVKGSPWNVLYNKNYATNGVNRTANSVAPATGTEVLNAANTDFSFTVTLEKPGDFYEATIQPHNYGTVKAYLNAINLTPTLSAAQAKYLSYTVTYNGTAYSGAGNSAIDGVELAPNGDATVVVRVEYLQPTSSDDLPGEDVTLTVTGSLVYGSTDDNNQNP